MQPGGGKSQDIVTNLSILKDRMTYALESVASGIMGNSRLDKKLSLIRAGVKRKVTIIY